MAGVRKQRVSTLACRIFLLALLLLVNNHVTNLTRVTCPTATQIDKGKKFLYIDGDSAGLAYEQLGGTKGLRGFGYWDIRQDDPK